MLDKVVAIIPARYGSSRFPGKVLADLEGKPVIQWVWERTRLASTVNETAVATDDERIKRAVEGFGGKVIMTSTEHQSGTDRLAEAVTYTTADIIVNVQGDEPLIHPDSVDMAVQAVMQKDDIPMSSLKKNITDYKEYASPNVVKVVCNNQDEALYFSRAPLPFYRDDQALIKEWENTGRLPDELCPPPYKHLGIYTYRANFLVALSKLPMSDLEKAEKLEQLRALSWGFKIKVVTTDHDSVGVDTPEDLENIRNMIARDPSLVKVES